MVKLAKSVTLKLVKPGLNCKQSLLSPSRDLK